MWKTKDKLLRNTGFNPGSGVANTSVTGLLTTTDTVESSEMTLDNVELALGRFQGVQNSVLRWVLWLLPWVIMILVIVIFIKYDHRAPGTIMYITGMIAAALSLFTFQFLMELIPETLSAMWNRKIMVDQPGMVLVNAKMTEDVFNPDNNASGSSRLENQYLEYIGGLEKWMNHPWQWVVGLAFSLLVFTWDYSLKIEFFIAFIIGLMAWRMAVASVNIWQLEKKFYLEPQLGHDDECGGLEPLGNLCLWNALIVTIPGIFLGGWILVKFISGQGTDYSSLSEYYTPKFYRLLLIPVAFAIVSFFLPLWGVHQTMVTWKARTQKQLDRLGYNINYLDSVLLNRADKLEPQESENMSKKLELMREIYQKNRSIPEWPFNTKIVIKFATSQAVAVLGLIEQSMFK